MENRVLAGRGKRLGGNMSYDSTPDTLAHIGQVQVYLAQVISALKQRAIVHDASKLEEPEKPMFDTFTPRLRGSTYGSPEYKEFLEAMDEGLRHHYAVNRHHPEHFDNGFAGMNLIDVIEMLADWKAATLRLENGDLEESITLNAHRFGYGGAFAQLLRNTARDLGWL